MILPPYVYHKYKPYGIFSYIRMTAYKDYLEVYKIMKLSSFLNFWSILKIRLLILLITRCDQKMCDKLN